LKRNFFLSTLSSLPETEFRMRKKQERIKQGIIDRLPGGKQASFRKKGEGEDYGIVLQFLGHGKLLVYYNGNNEKVCIIPKEIKTSFSVCQLRRWINKGDVVLTTRNEEKKSLLVIKYSHTQVQKLLQIEERLPFDINLNKCGLPKEIVFHIFSFTTSEQIPKVVWTFVYYCL